MTPSGEGRVKDRDVLKRVVRVQLADEPGLVEFPVDRLSPVGAVDRAPGGKDNQDNEDIKDGSDIHDIPDVPDAPEVSDVPGASDPEDPAT
jgi:hypothetical protein